MRNSNLGIQASFTPFSIFQCDSPVAGFIPPVKHSGLLHVPAFISHFPSHSRSHLLLSLRISFPQSLLWIRPWQLLSGSRYFIVSAFPCLLVSTHDTVSRSSIDTVLLFGLFFSPASILIFLRLPPSPKFPVRSHFSHRLCKRLSVEPISSLPSTSPVFGFAPLSTS